MPGWNRGGMLSCSRVWVVRDLYWDYIGILEKKMETTIMGNMGSIGLCFVISGLWGFGFEILNFGLRVRVPCLCEGCKEGPSIREYVRGLTNTQVP